MTFLFSSFLAFVGMIVGILLGNIEHFTPWIFMGTAGVFMYVALVDMMPGKSISGLSDQDLLWRT